MSYRCFNGQWNAAACLLDRITKVINILENCKFSVVYLIFLFRLFRGFALSFWLCLPMQFVLMARRRHHFSVSSLPLPFRCNKKDRVWLEYGSQPQYAMAIHFMSIASQSQIIFSSVSTTTKAGWYLLSLLPSIFMMQIPNNRAFEHFAVFIERVVNSCAIDLCREVIVNMCFGSQSEFVRGKPTKW